MWWRNLINRHLSSPCAIGHGDTNHLYHKQNLGETKTKKSKAGCCCFYSNKREKHTPSAKVIHSNHVIFTVTLCCSQKTPAFSSIPQQQTTSKCTRIANIIGVFLAISLSIGGGVAAITISLQINSSH